jgi:DNA-binding response OmpR family regulator
VYRQHAVGPKEVKMDTKKLILVADDEVMLRNLIRTVLFNEGYQVLTAADGNEALVLSRGCQEHIDLLLFDVEMPHLDGISAYKRISGERPDTKVLFMSGGTVQSALPEPWPFMAKPFNSKTLLAKVSDILKTPLRAIGRSPAVILVVDQNEDRKKRTKDTLTGSGYAVLTASSVKEAEALSTNTKKIDLIISEVMFSGDSGVQFAEREASDRKIPTLLISHFHSDILNKVPGFSKQAEFLANPFTSEGLLKRVRQLLKTSSGSAATA